MTTFMIFQLYLGVSFIDEVVEVIAVDESPGYSENEGILLVVVICTFACFDSIIYVRLSLKKVVKVLMMQRKISKFLMMMY